MLEQVLSGFDDTTGFLEASQRSAGTPHKSPGFKAVVTPEKIDKSPMPNPDVFHPKVSASASSSSAAPAASSAEVGLASPVSKSPKEIKHKEKDKSKKTETEKVKHKDKSAKASKKPKEADGLKVKKADKLKK